MSSEETPPPLPEQGESEGQINVDQARTESPTKASEEMLVQGQENIEEQEKPAEDVASDELKSGDDVQKADSTEEAVKESPSPPLMDEIAKAEGEETIPQGDQETNDSSEAKEDEQSAVKEVSVDEPAQPNTQREVPSPRPDSQSRNAEPAAPVRVASTKSIASIASGAGGSSRQLVGGQGSFKSLPVFKGGEATPQIEAASFKSYAPARNNSGPQNGLARAGSGVSVTGTRRDVVMQDNSTRENAEAARRLEVDKKLEEVLARQRLLEEDRDNLEMQVQALRLKADMEAQARQAAEAAREAAEEELRYRSRVQGQTDGKTQKLIDSLQMTVDELQAQLQEVQSQETLVVQLRERVDKAEQEMKEKGAQFQMVKAELERRLQQQQQLLVKNRSYLEGVGRRKQVTSNALQSAVAELRGKRRETEEIAGGLDALLRRLDQFVLEEASRIKGLTDIKEAVGSMKGGGSGSIAALEELEVQLRQERDGSVSDYQAQRRLEDELLMHLGHQGQHMHGLNGMGNDYGGGGGYAASAPLLLSPYAERNNMGGGMYMAGGGGGGGGVGHSHGMAGIGAGGGGGMMMMNGYMGAGGGIDAWGAGGGGMGDVGGMGGGRGMVGGGGFSGGIMGGAAGVHSSYDAPPLQYGGMFGGMPVMPPPSLAYNAGGGGGAREEAGGAIRVSGVKFPSITDGDAKLVRSGGAGADKKREPLGPGGPRDRRLKGLQGAPAAKGAAPNAAAIAGGVGGEKPNQPGGRGRGIGAVDKAVQGAARGRGRV